MSLTPTCSRSLSDSGGVFVDFDDGHLPENLPRATPTKLVDYPWLFVQKTARVHVFQGALPESLVDAAYHKTVDSQHPSWGDYVTLSQIQNFWDSTSLDENDIDNDTGRNSRRDGSNSNSNSNIKPADLVVRLAAHYLKLTMDSNPALQFKKNGETIEQQGQCSALWRADDLHKVHGVAVWALAAKVGSQVPYHLDYAEQIRYESNLIVPPLLAGTLQCTKDALIGGDFLVSLEGIPHYQRHGYKATAIDEEMIRIPYQYNQLACHHGNLPHASTKIQEIKGSQRRVIVGFNVFGHDFGQIVQKAPEHSDAFRRKVQVQRAFSNKKMTLQQVQQNKVLSKLLVLAKRERIKQEFQQAQQRIAKDLPDRLPATVHDLMTLYYDNNRGSCWPSSRVDVQVFLHHQIKEGKFHVVNLESLPGGTSRKDLISPMALIDLSPLHSKINSSLRS
jgi:hypothetical protein